MRKMIAGLATGILLALGGVAGADMNCVDCDEYDMEVRVNGQPFYGKWAMIDDRPFVGIEALSDLLALPRAHNYKAWNVDREGMSGGDPLKLMTQTKDGEVKTVRFGGVTMVDLYGIASALDLPVHHNFRAKIIQVGDNYEGENMKGAWYRYKARAHGWRLWDDMERYRVRNKLPSRYQQWDDSPNSSRPQF